MVYVFSLMIWKTLDITFETTRIIKEGNWEIKTIGATKGLPRQTSLVMICGSNPPKISFLMVFHEICIFRKNVSNKSCSP